MQVRLQECQFTANTPATKPVLLADNKDADLYKATFYSDAKTPLVCSLDATGTTSVAGLQCNSSSPETLAAAGDRFLSASDAWMETVQAVRILLIV